MNTTIDFETASAETLRQHAETGDQGAVYELAVRCIADDGRFEITHEERPLFVAAALGGDDVAAYVLGSEAYNLVDDPDLDAAERWLRLAADQRHPGAMRCLAQVLFKQCEEDLGAPEFQEAIMWICRAYSAGVINNECLAFMCRGVSPETWHAAQLEALQPMELCS